jgi:hypothetical protein
MSNEGKSWIGSSSSSCHFFYLLSWFGEHWVLFDF